MPWNKGYLS